MNIAQRMKNPVKLNYKLLDADDVANVVINSLATPPSVLVSILIIKRIQYIYVYVLIFNLKLT